MEEKEIYKKIDKREVDLLKELYKLTKKEIYKAELLDLFMEEASEDIN